MGHHVAAPAAAPAVEVVVVQLTDDAARGHERPGAEAKELMGFQAMPAFLGQVRGIRDLLCGIGTQRRSIFRFKEVEIKSGGFVGWGRSRRSARQYWPRQCGR